MFDDRQRIFLLEQDYNTAKNKLLHKDEQIQNLINQIKNLECKNNEMNIKIQQQNQIIKENNLKCQGITDDQGQSSSKNQSDLTQYSESKLNKKLQKEALENIIELSSKAIQTSQLLVQKCISCASYINIINEKQQQDLKHLSEHQEQKKQIIEYIQNDRKNFDLDKILASNKEELQMYKAQLDEQLIQIQQKKEKYKQAKDKEIAEKIAFNSKNFKQ